MTIKKKKQIEIWKICTDWDNSLVAGLHGWSQQIIGSGKIEHFKFSFLHGIPVKKDNTEMLRRLEPDSHVTF